MMLWTKLKEFTRLIDPRGEKFAQPGLCCVSASTEGLAFAYLLRESDNEQPILRHCQFISCTPDKHQEALTTLVNEYRLAGAACSFLLQPESYRILTMDALPVEPSEMVSALRWHLKELIDFPVTEAAIDYFPAPSDTVLGSKPNNLNVVVTRMNHVQAIANLVRNSGLVLTTIDIPELALRNCSALFTEDTQGLGMIWTNSGGNQLVITRHKNLYHTRFMERVKLAKIAEQAVTTIDVALEEMLDKFTLELQRSLDYYQSQLRQSPPTKLYITLDQQILLDYLSGQLISKLEPLNLSTVLNCEEPLTGELERRCLGVIGGALREA